MTSSLWALLVANLWELVGVLLFGWDVFVLAFVYWAENVVVGLYNIPRILMAGGRSEGGSPRLFLIGKILIVPFFVFHYGIFTAVHGLLVSGLWKAFGEGHGSGGPAGLFILLVEGPAAQAVPLWVAFLLLFYSHGHSFVVNTLVKKELRDVEPQKQMSAPYKRVAIMQAFVLVGFVLMAWLGTVHAFALLLVALKTAVDAWSHRREHARPGA